MKLAFGNTGLCLRCQTGYTPIRILGFNNMVNKRWTKVLNSPNFQWMPNPFGFVIVNVPAVKYLRVNYLAGSPTGLSGGKQSWLLGTGGLANQTCAPMGQAHGGRHAATSCVHAHKCLLSE